MSLPNFLDTETVKVIRDPDDPNTVSFEVPAATATTRGSSLNAGDTYATGDSTIVDGILNIPIVGIPADGQMLLFEDTGDHIGQWIPTPRAATFALVAHKYLDSYDAVTGLFTSSLVAQADVTGLAAALAALIPLTYLDTDVTLAANSDSKIATQKAVKAYVAAAVAGGGAVTSVAGRTGAVVLAESDITSLVSDLAAKAPTSRTISTTAPLTGGGDLSANRTLAVSVATSSVVGVVKVDGTTISVDGTGTLRAVGGGIGAGVPYDVFTAVPGYLTRTINTVYQNTTSFPNIVVVALVTVANNGTSIQALSDASNPPTTIVAHASTQDGSFGLGTFLVFVVQPGEYYKIPTSAGASSISRITEYVMSGSVTDSGEISGSRAYNTVYQNTSGYVKWVAVQVTGNGGITNLLSDTANPPTTQIWRQKTIGTAATMTVFAPIMDGHYYKLTNNGTGAINRWHEYTWNGITGVRSITLSSGNQARGVDSSSNPNRVYRNTMGRSMWTIVCGSPSSLGTLIMNYDNISGGRYYGSAVDSSSTLVMSPSFPTPSPTSMSAHNAEDSWLCIGTRYDELYAVRRDNVAFSLTSWYEWFFS